MPYKIVQTLERGKPKLSIVPSFWEDNGNLWWPPKKSLDKAMKDDQSKPNKDWRLMNCNLKRNNIRIYKQADIELSIMEQNSDTDAQVNNTTMIQPREIVLQSENQEVINFELLANNLEHSQGNQGTSNINLNENIVTTENVLHMYSAEPFNNFDQILANQKVLSEKIDTILQIQSIAIENQKKITQKLAALSVQVEEISLQLAELRENPTEVTMLKDVNPIENESFSIKPIESEAELIALEQILSDKAQYLKLQKQLSFICSPSVGGGITCAYKLLDIIFTRNFLCLCSWSGGSRGEKSKIGLKNYKNVLKFFFTMIHSWDATYTVQENENFFKIATKNSLQRKCMKNLRTSTKRYRKNENNKVKRQKTKDEELLNETTKKIEEKCNQIQEKSIEIEKIPPNSDDENESFLC